MGKPKQRKPPAVGSEYKRTTSDGKTHVLTVIKESGVIKYRLGNKVFESPSGAGRSIRGTEVNGWVYWRIDT
jgi:hypothetical protein